MSGTSRDRFTNDNDALADQPTIGLRSTEVGGDGLRVSEPIASPQALPEPGAIFASRYVLGEVVGKGGFGAVYEATDRLTGARVAVKLLQRGLGDELTDLRRETTILRLLRLPGAAALLDEGIEGSWPFLVMDFAAGTPFPGDGCGQTWDAIREPVISLLEVLARVHAHGVMHRDLKPGNVLVDENGRATVVDFGLSRAVDDVRRELTIAGTPAYIAPEQLAGVSGEPRSDLYAVGTMIFEALTGSLPYQATTVSDLLQRKRIHAPRSLATLSPDAPTEVVAAVDAMLAPRPADRPRSAAAALALLRGEPVRDVVSELVAAADGVCTREMMQAWFRGPERYLRLRSDAATELWRRTAGASGRVEDELRAWLRAGVARLIDGQLEVPRPQLERLRAGLRVSVHEVTSQDEPSPDDEVLAWAELAWPSADVATIARASGADSAEVRAAVDRAVDDGDALRVTDDRIIVAAGTGVLGVWPEARRRQAHAALAAALEAGSRGRLIHTAQTGSLDEVLRESLATGERAVADGAVDEAVGAVEEGVRLLRLMPGHDLVSPLLHLLARVAMLQGSESALNMALYHLEFDGFDARGLDYVRELVRAMWLEIRSDSERAMAAAHGLGPAEQDALEWWRIALMNQCANLWSPDAHEAVVEELIRDFVRGRPGIADLEYHMLGRVRYRQGRFEESARAYERSAELRAQPTQRLSARLNAASAWMEAGQFDRAINLARQARMEAASVRHAVFEARAEWIERAACYRRGEDLIPEPTIVEAAPEIGIGWLAILLLQNEAAFAWRAGEDALAIRWAESAAAMGGRESAAGIVWTCRAFVWWIGRRRPPVSDEEFERAINVCSSPAMAEQLAWMLWQASDDVRWKLHADRLRTSAATEPGGVRYEFLERDVARRPLRAAGAD